MNDNSWVLAKVGSGVLKLLSIYQVVLGLYFILVRPSMLPEDLRFVHGSHNVLQAAAPHLESWLQWVFAVLGGQMIAVGALLFPLACKARNGASTTRETIALVVAGASSVLLMSVTNFAISSDYRWALTVPVILWSVALYILFIGKSE